MALLNLDGLQQLPVEIILNIVIQLGWKPGDIASLLGSSKRIRFVLKTNEKLLSQQFALHLYSMSMDPILSRSSITVVEPKRTLSRVPRPVRLPYTFPWIAEQEKRKKILSNSPLLDITIPNLLLVLFGTFTRICGTCGLYGMDAFKSHGLNMLLRLADARIAGSKLAEERKISNDDTRRSQELWICQQDAHALASTLALVWVASMMFDYGDSSAGGAGSCEDNGYRIGESSAEGSNLVKRQCAYRELVLAHGPYFLWCSVSESEEETSWVKKMLDEGVEGLKYETEGGLVCYGLQSVLLRRLDGLEGWEEWEGWDDMFSAFGKEILLCKTRVAR